MYNWDKLHKDDKPRKNGQTPYFSLTLLDEIYRSIDGSDEKFGEFKVRKPKVAKKPIRGKKGVLDNDPLFFSSGLSSSDSSFGWHFKAEV
nr:protein BIG GRAIN 1-like A [Tanacetum cinerariifolium]